MIDLRVAARFGAFSLCLGACGENDDPAGDGSSTGSSTGSSNGDPTGSPMVTTDADSTGAPTGEPVAIANSSFETPAVMPGGLNLAGPPMGWSLVDPETIINGQENSVGVLNPEGTSLFVDGAPDGSNVALIFLWQTQGTPVGLTQVLGETLTAGTTYRLGVDIGNIAPTDAPYDLSGFPGYRVELRAGDTVLVADVDTVAPGEGTFLRTELTYTANPSAPIGQPLEIRLINLSREDSGIEVNFDDVQLHAEAP